MSSEISSAAPRSARTTTSTAVTSAITSRERPLRPAGLSPGAGNGAGPSSGASGLRRWLVHARGLGSRRVPTVRRYRCWIRGRVSKVGKRGIGLTTGYPIVAWSLFRLYFGTAPGPQTGHLPRSTSHSRVPLKGLPGIDVCPHNRFSRDVKTEKANRGSAIRALVCASQFRE